ncbi:hypothetical protein [Solitalea lacus]|nr:hypothetical protein [Solitalea lacus]UKJ07463.1 hypothetical protein L2B55_18320 [Solitalea lacus]
MPLAENTGCAINVSGINKLHEEYKVHNIIHSEVTREICHGKCGNSA